MSNALIAAHKAYVEPLLAHPDALASSKIQPQLTSLWARSNGSEKDQYLAHLSNRWCKAKNPAQEIEKTLTLHPFLDWNTPYDKATPWWMHLFIESNAPLYPYSSSFTNAFSGWWVARKNQASQIDAWWEPCASFNDKLFSNSSPFQEKSQSPSTWRTKLLLRNLNNLVRLASANPKNHRDRPGVEQVGNDILEFSLVLSLQQEKKGVPDQWNQVKGQTLDAAFYSKNSSPLWEQARKEFEKSDILFLTQASQFFSTNDPTFRLVGRPEALFKHPCHQILTSPTPHLFDQDQQDFEEKFWLACQARWEDRQNDPRYMNDHASFFLNSLHVWLPERMPLVNPEHVRAWKVFTDKVKLCADSGLWPWLNQDRAVPQRRM